MNKCEKTENLSSKKMEPKQIHELIKHRGWMAKEVADRWGIKPRRMSQIIQDTDRKKYYDDAFVGLPTKTLKKD